MKQNNGCYGNCINSFDEDGDSLIDLFSVSIVSAFSLTMLFILFCFNINITGHDSISSGVIGIFLLFCVFITVIRYLEKIEELDNYELPGYKYPCFLIS
jgi:hypothetical protein